MTDLEIRKTVYDKYVESGDALNAISEAIRLKGGQTEQRIIHCEFDVVDGEIVGKTTHSVNDVGIIIRAMKKFVEECFQTE